MTHCYALSLEIKIRLDLPSPVHETLHVCHCLGPFLFVKNKMILWLRILAFWSFRDFGLDRGQCARMQFRKKPLFLVTKKTKSRGSKRDQSASCPSRGERGCEGGLRPALHQYCSSARPSSNTGVPAQIYSD